MRRTRILMLLGFVLIVGVCNFALASSTTPQTVTFQVAAIDEISTSGGPVALIVNSATAGSQPNSATNATTTYAITTNETNKKITGSLDSAMPAGTTLTINLAAPTGATSQGNVSLSNVASDLVTGISTVAASGNAISYTFSATAAAGVLTSTTRTVTLTITN